MMEDDLIDRLKADVAIAGIVGTKVYAGRAQQSAQWPFIIVNTTSRRRFPSSAGVAAFVSSRVQVDSYGATYGQAHTLADKCRLSLNGLAGVVGSSFVRAALIESESDTDSAPLAGQGKGAFRVSQGFMVQYTESTS